MKAWRHLLYPVIATGAGILLALVAGEVAVRWTWSPRVSPVPGKPRLGPGAKLPRLENIAALVKPNQLGIYNGAVYRTNSAGFRGREYEIPKPEDTVRIVVIGDSITMGSGVEHYSAYSACLEQMLQTASDYSYEILNLGVAGLNLRTAIDTRLVKLGLRYEPDLVVYGFTLNDLEGQEYRFTSDRTGPLIPRVRGSGSHLLELMRTRWRYLMELVAPPSNSYVAELDFNYFENSPAWNAFHSDLKRFAAIVRQRDICGLLLIHTQLRTLNGFHPFHRHYQKVASAARALDLFVVDPYERFAGHAAHRFWVRPFDEHPNEEGHALLADALIQGIRQLPDRCWHGGAQPTFGKQVGSGSKL